jgi:hypothetical protein
MKWAILVLPAPQKHSSVTVRLCCACADSNRQRFAPFSVLSEGQTAIATLSPVEKLTVFGRVLARSCVAFKSGNSFRSRR